MCDKYLENFRRTTRQNELKVTALLCLEAGHVAHLGPLYV